LALDDGAAWRGVVSLVEPTGADTYVVVKTEAADVTVRVAPLTPVAVGDTVGLRLTTEAPSWFDVSTQRRLNSR
jgi:multiple sugar transport system ATP-binding protein